MRIIDALPELPGPIACQTLHELMAALPPPLADSQADRDTREQVAVAAVADLHPADAFEALLASQIIAANAHAMDCLRLAGQPDVDADTVRRCRAQAGMMMRHMQSGLRTLQRAQAAREKALAAMQPGAMERAGYWYRDASSPPAGVSRDDAAHLTAQDVRC
jgi:hypothetical protein